ncbi:hypothetical protein ES288_A11G338900v1 [Gossypium darwinii]|uniref:Uncharacterized protein n=1 Tax=Gossypium darwinii TaxID=34276 RepID=A0A5D2ETI1_GOSDA|nr:hypothetical protein ES288_A11G338900v1 [Gossypium darwinii]
MAQLIYKNVVNLKIIANILTKIYSPKINLLGLIPATAEPPFHLVVDNAQAATRFHQRRLRSRKSGTAVRRSEETAHGNPTPWHCSGVFQKFLVFSVVDFLWVQLGLGFRVWVYSIGFKKSIWAAFNLIYYLGLMVCKKLRLYLFIFN